MTPAPIASRITENVVRRFLDPEPFSEEEDRAVGYGLAGIPLGTEGESLYFGLVGTNSVDDEELIPIFSSIADWGGYLVQEYKVRNSDPSSIG